MAAVTEEIIRCFDCGGAFTRPAIELDPRRDAAVLNDEVAMRTLSGIACPHCGYTETRPVQVRMSIERSNDSPVTAKTSTEGANT